MASRFSNIQALAVSDRRVSNSQFRTLAALGTYSDRRGWCFPSLKLLGKLVGKSKQAVSADLIALSKLGYIEIRHRYRPEGGKTSNEYRLIFDLPDTHVPGEENMEPTPCQGGIDTCQDDIDTLSISEVDTLSISEVDTLSISEVDTLSISEVDTLTTQLTNQLTPQRTKNDTTRELSVENDVRAIIEKLTGIPAQTPNDLKALGQLAALRPTAADIEQAVQWYAGQGKTVRYYSSLVGPTQTAKAQRIQAANGYAPQRKKKVYIDPDGNRVEVDA